MNANEHYLKLNKCKDTVKSTLNTKIGNAEVEVNDDFEASVAKAQFQM